MDSIKNSAMDLIHHVRSNDDMMIDITESALVSMGVPIDTCIKIENMAMQNKHCQNILTSVNLW